MGVSALGLIIVPMFIFIILAMINGSTNTNIEGNFSVIYNDTWPNPDDSKYDTWFGNDPVGYFVDAVYFLFAKVSAFFTIVQEVLAPTGMVIEGQTVNLSDLLWINITLLLLVVVGFIFFIRGLNG